MHRVLFILAVFVLVAVSGQDAHAARFGTQSSYQHLRDLTEKGPKGEALALGYVTVTHSFIAPYKMTGYYALLVRGGGRDLNGRPISVYDELPAAKIEQMQRAGALPNPLPLPRHTIFDYLFAYILWWGLPVALGVVALFQTLGFGSRTRDETRPA